MVAKMLTFTQPDVDIHKHRFPIVTWQFVLTAIFNLTEAFIRL